MGTAFLQIDSGMSLVVRVERVLEWQDNRLRFSRRPAALARMGEGVAAAGPAGWPVHVRGGLEKRKTSVAACGPREGVSRLDPICEFFLKVVRNFDGPADGPR